MGDDHMFDQIDMRLHPEINHLDPVLITVCKACVEKARC